MKEKLLLKMLVVFILALGFSMFLPIVHNDEIKAALAPATFLFSAIYGFEIAIVLRNFTKLQELLANEIGDLIYIFHIAKGIGGEFAKRVDTQVEEYFMDSIDNSLNTHISATNKDFAAVVEPIEAMKIENDKDAAALNGINRGLLDLAKSRSQMGQVAPWEVGVAEWTLLIFLTAIILTALFFGRQTGLVSELFIAIFSTALVSTLLLLNEADSNHLQEALLQYEEYNQALEEIGKKRYYPEFALKKKLVKSPKGKEYRIGTFPNYPNLEVRHIT